MTENPSKPTTSPSQTVDDSSSAASNSAPLNDAEGASPSFGWNTYAEKLNGRFAMVGFVALLIQQLVTREDFFSWIGIF